MFSERTPFQECGYTSGMKLPTVSEIQAAIAAVNFSCLEGVQFKQGLQEALTARKSS